MTLSNIVKSWEEANCKVTAMLLNGAESDGRYKTLFVKDSSQNSVTEDGDEAAPSSGKVLIIPKTPILTDVTLLLHASGATVQFTAPHPPGVAKVATLTNTLSPTVSAGGAKGQGFDIMKIYDLSAVSDEKFLQNFSGNTPVYTRDIRDKGVLQHRKRMANVERTLSITQLFTNYENGLAKLSQIPFVFAVLREDNQAGLVTEVLYYYQCYFHNPMPNESVGDNDTDLSFELTYERFCAVDADAVSGLI